MDVFPDDPGAKLAKPETFDAEPFRSTIISILGTSSGRSYDVLEEKFIENEEYEKLPGNQQTLRNYIHYLEDSGQINREPEHRRIYDYVFDTPPGDQMLIDFGEETLSKTTHIHFICLSLPLYRQEKDWLQFGAEFSRTIIAKWIINCVGRYFIHVYGFFHRGLLKRGFLMADETRIQVLKEPERRAQSQSYMWLVKSGEDGLPPIILFGYTENRAKYHIERFLEGYGGGYLETDGYQGYNNLKNIRCCCCWAHVRRYFMDAVPKGKQDDLSVPAYRQSNTVVNCLCTKDAARNRGILLNNEKNTGA